MEVTARREITVAIDGDNVAAEAVKRYYESIGYVLFEENEDWIQLDKNEGQIRGAGRWR